MLTPLRREEIQHMQRWTWLKQKNPSTVVTTYRRSNSFVRRKFKIGAKAVGSLSINICRWRNIRQDIITNHSNLPQVLMFLYYCYYKYKWHNMVLSLELIKAVLTAPVSSRRVDILPLSKLQHTHTAQINTSSSPLWLTNTCNKHKSHLFV